MFYFFQTKGSLMKKMILSVAMVATMSEFQASEQGWMSKALTSSKTNWPVTLISAATLGLYMYHSNTKLHDYCKNLHEQKINQAQEGIESLTNICASILLGVHTEAELLSNVESVGLNKLNALEICKQFEQLQTLVDAYDSLVAPWNWTEKMKKTTTVARKFLKQYAMYAAYFNYHKPCLQAWFKVEFYQSKIDFKLTDANKILKQLPEICGASDSYKLADTVDFLQTEVNFVKDFLRNEDYRKLYPKVYAQAHELVSKLTICIDTIAQSFDYKKEYDKRTKDGVMSSSIK